MKLECKDCNKIKELTKVRFVFINNKFVADVKCECGKYMKDISEQIPLSEKSFSIATFQSLSNEDKQNMLKKRSHEHYEKKIKPEKDYKHNLIVKQVKNVIKHGTD